MKGNNCGFLHQFDKSRMPTCRFFAKYNECREPDCPFKHSLEDVKDCNMYKLGFCIHGPNCRYRHAKQDGPPPGIQEAALIGRPGHLHGAPPRHLRAMQNALALRQDQGPGAPGGPGGRGGRGGRGVPRGEVGCHRRCRRGRRRRRCDGWRRRWRCQMRPAPGGAGFQEPPLAGGGVPGMPGAAAGGQENHSLPLT